MCTRYTLLEKDLRAIVERLRVALDLEADVASRYNIGPATEILAVRPLARAAGREAVKLRWGLTPSWAHDDEPASRLVNARAETLVEKPSFRDAFRSRRCLIPASGFFEWEHVGKARRPWLFRRPDESPFGLAGLWETWRAPDGTFIESCAVITTEPNELMRPIHHRMPVMLAPAQFDAWLDPAIREPERLRPLLHPALASDMKMTEVSTHVNNVRHDDPGCLAPASADKSRDGGEDSPQLSLGF